MIKTLSFSVTGQCIEIVEPAMLVAGTVNIYTAVFSFDAEWDDYVKTAVFRCGGIEKEKSLSGNSCTVPWEVLIKDEYLRIGIYGVKSDGTRLPTIWTDRLLVHPGAGPTEEAAEPSPTLVEQLLTKVGNLDSLKTEDKSSLVAAINEVWASGGGGSGASVTDAAINEDGHLIITLSTGKAIDAGYAVGPAGADGKDGAPGASGADGASAYEIAVANDFVGTEAEWLESLRGADAVVDDTLTQPGQAADAATVGKRLDSLSEEIANIPSGKDGADGQDGVGIQSVVQTTTSAEDGGTNVVTVTKTDGTSSTFQVKNGSKGSTGQAGADGHTPVKGTDYWTTADQQAIVDDVLAALPAWEGGSY